MPPRSCNMKSCLLALLCAAAPTAALKNVVVLGSGDPWLSLCTAKTASARGLPATCVSNNEPEALKMLWGKGFDGASPVKVVNGPDAIGEALADCEGLVLNGAESVSYTHLTLPTIYSV